MIRLLGAITGSALALATLLVLIGIPQFKTEPKELDRAVMTLPLPTTPVEMPTQQALESDSGEATAAVPTAVAQTANEPMPAEENDESPNIESNAVATAAEMPIETADSMAPIGALEAFDQTPAVFDDAQSWYAFWSPFRSEVAASGFVNRLQSVTGLDYRVVKLKPGVYEVAFAYVDDNDIINNLSQITAATGLEMPQQQ